MGYKLCIDRLKLSALILLIAMSVACTDVAANSPYKKQKIIAVTTDVGENMLVHSEAKNFIASMSDFVSQQSL